MSATEDEPRDPVQAMAWAIVPLVDDLPRDRFREIEDTWVALVAYIRMLEATIEDAEAVGE